MYSPNIYVLLLYMSRIYFIFAGLSSSEVISSWSMWLRFMDWNWVKQTVLKISRQYNNWNLVNSAFNSFIFHFLCCKVEWQCYIFQCLDVDNTDSCFRNCSLHVFLWDSTSYSAVSQILLLDLLLLYKFLSISKYQSETEASLKVSFLRGHTL